MKTSERIRQRGQQTRALGQSFNELADKSIPDLEYHMNFTLTSIAEFLSNFELQLSGIKEAENLCKLRTAKLEATNQDILFWNHLKFNILDRQKNENMELIRTTERVTKEGEQIAEAERQVLEEMTKARSEEEKEAEASNMARSTVAKSIVGIGKTNPKFNLSEKLLLLSVQRGNEINEFQLQFIPDKSKYIPTQEYHPKVMALISQFNFHKSLPRLQHQLTELINTA